MKSNTAGQFDPHSTRRVQILVAEDNSANQKLIVDMLEPQGYQVQLADNGRDAVTMVRDGEFDIVLMDVQMPEMDGFQATMAIRDLTPPKSGVPVIAITSLIRNSDRQACLTAGANAYLPKPVDKERLLSMLESWLRKPDHAATARTERQSAMSIQHDSANPLESHPSDAGSVMNLEVALARMGQDQSLLWQLAEFFLEDAPLLLAEIEAGEQAQDAALVNRAAHSLKGLAANFEALPAVSAGKLVEAQSKQSDLAGCRESIPALRTEIAKLTEALEAELAKGKSSPS